MARSAYIYLVVRPEDGNAIAAFTVKHEMMTWLDRNKDNGPMSCYRMGDGLRRDKGPDFMGHRDDLLEP